MWVRRMPGVPETESVAVRVWQIESVWKLVSWWGYKSAAWRKIPCPSYWKHKWGNFSHKVQYVRISFFQTRNIQRIFVITILSHFFSYKWSQSGALHFHSNNALFKETRGWGHFLDRTVHYFIQTASVPKSKQMSPHLKGLSKVMTTRLRFMNMMEITNSPWWVVYHILPLSFIK